MKSIAPERCQRELAGEQVAADFGFAFADQGAISRVHFQAARRHRDGACVRFRPTCSRLSCSAFARRLLQICVMRPRGSVSGDRTDGFGKEYDAGQLWSTFMNETGQDHHIITIEDPIEFYHYHKMSTVNQREVGVDVPSVFPKRFKSSVASGPRRDPRGRASRSGHHRSGDFGRGNRSRRVRYLCTPTVLRVP